MGSFWGSGGTSWEVGSENGQMYVKEGGGGLFSLSLFGQKKWARELAGRCPGDPKIGRRRPEERTKRLCEEKIVKTSKTSTLSSEKRGLSGREGLKIQKKSGPKWLGRLEK